MLPRRILPNAPKFHLILLWGLLLGPCARAAVDKVICVPWQGDPLKYHTGIDGQTIRLQAVVRTTDGSPVWYKWVYGDGTESPVGSLSGGTSYNVESDHVYNGSVGTPFTARLLVDGVDDTLAHAQSDPYLVKLEDNGLDARVNIAIDNGLWYLHKQKYHDGSTLSFNGKAVALWIYSSYYASPTASAIHAFQINGHKQTGDPDEDPYANDVKEGLNWIFNGYYSNPSLPMLRSSGMTLQNGQDPDSNGNGIGIEVRDYGYAPIYEGGMVMDAIIASGTPDEDSGRDFDGDGVNETYRQVLQDMCDQYAWGQCDQSDGQGGLYGGWRYGWNDFPDNSACQWAAIGMIPAQQAPWNCLVPQWVKTHDNEWLNYSHSAFNGGTWGGFGYTGPSAGEATTPSGMVQLNFVGATTADPRWVRCERWFADNWGGWLSGHNTYAYYALAKAMRLGQPTPVTTFTSSGFDWYRGDAGTSGLAKLISDELVANHSRSSPWVNENLATAWSVIILRPVLFQEAPIACFTAQPNPTYPDAPIEFNPACSGHSDPAKSRDNLVLYEWDWDSDGVFDEASTGPEIRTHAFSCAMVPCLQPVTLRVTDDVGNTATYRQNVQITNPPHPPVARTRGPFWVSLCADDTLQLDATDSFDVDAGQREAGCLTCPVDGVTAWNWDLDGAPFNFDGPSGARIDLGTGFRALFPTPGTYDIGVRVSDNTALAFPGSGQPNLTSDAFTQVLVFGEGVCHLAAVARCQGADLTWDEVPGASFTVWVSSQSPNTGFKETANTLDHQLTISGLPVGVPRWVRVSAQLPTGLLLSEPVEVVADASLCAPLADAGGPYQGCAGKPVTLTAEASTAPLGTIVSWEWDLNNDGNFDDASGAQIQHTFDQPGTYIVRVRVTAASAVTLTGEASTTVKVDRCGCIDSLVARAKLDKIQLVWTPEADAASYNLHRSPSPWFTPSDQTLIARNISTQYATYLDEHLPVGQSFFYRVVKVGANGQEVCASNEAGATTAPRGGNVPPAANAGPDQIVQIGDPVRLDGTGSFDANGNRLNYRWRLIAGPASSQSALQDDHTARPTFVPDLKGAYTFELIVNDSLVDSLPDTVSVKTQNTPPVADPGPDQQVPVGTLVQLDGSASTDADGDPLTYRWVLSLRPAQSNAVLDDPTAQKPTFPVDAAGEYEVSLIVNDGLDDSAPVKLSVTTVNSPPVARAGADRVVPVGVPVEVDGSASSDVDGDALSFAWSLSAVPPGSTATLGTPHGVKSTFTPDLPGLYQVQLVVSDGQALSLPAVVKITANAAPIALAGADTATPVGVAVMLDGTASHDPENDPLSYLWTVASAPAGSTADFSDAHAAKPTFTPDRKGQYTLRLVVSDGLSTSLPDELVLSTLNSAPVANAGPDLAVTVGQLVALSGTASGDLDGDPLTYHWELTDRPTGSAAALDNPLSATPKFTADLPGAYQARLIVNDGLLDSAPDSVLITTANRPPVANAGVGQAKFVGETFALNGSASSDPDGDPLTYAWSVSVRPFGSTADVQAAGSPTPTFVPDLAGLYQIQLIVADGRGGSAAATVNLTAKAFVVGPDLSGLTETEARAAIEAAGLHVGQVIPRSDEVILPGFVLEQIPPAGTKLDPGALVDLVVSSGPDVQAPVVTVTADPAFSPIGGTVTLRVSAVDDGLVGNFSLMVNGVPVVLLGNQATFVCSAVGSYHAVATAEDAVGNVGQGETTFYATDPSDTTPPTVVITEPADDSGVTKPTAVKGSVFDPAGQFASYTVEYAPVAQVDMSTLESPAYVIIGSGTTEVHDGTLAMFDPTLLSNDAYVIRVSAWDQNGQGRREFVVVNVFGNLKLGNFHLEFTDLTVPVAGIPIQITRIYDTLQAGIKGDFGYGWRLGLRDARIYETLRNYVGYKTFYPGTRVFINTPDGRRVGFTAYTKSSAFFGFVFVEVALRPDPGVYEKLQFKGSADGQLNAVYYQGAYLGGLATEAFDPNDYVLTTKDGTVYEYSQSEGLQKVTDLTGNHLDFTTAGIFHFSSGAAEPDQKVDFVRDAEQRITSIIDPNGNPLTYIYDALGNLASFADQVGNTTQYFYRSAPAHYLDRIVDPLGRDALRSEYDASGRLVAVRDALGNLISQEFDQANNTVKFQDANGNLNLVQYDDNGNEVLKAIPGVSTNAFVFDASNNLLRAINGRGFETNFTYDASGNVTSITDALGAQTTITYNAQSKPDKVVNALGQTLDLHYDGAGNVLEVINNAGLKTTVSRDSQGRVVSSTDAAGNTTQFDYSGGCSCGKPGKTINPDGSFQLTEYDSLGNTTRAVNELGAETLSSYDASGKLLSTRDPLFNTTRFFYNGSLLTHVVDALDRTNRFEYDSLNRTNAVIDAQGGVVRFEYDGNGNRTKVTDPVGKVTRFVYDAGNRLVQQIDPLTHTNFFAYDAAGNRTEAIDRNGRRRTFAYDGVNRMTNEVWWEGASSVRSITFGFNALGVQTLAADPAARYDYTYDSLNRLQGVAQTAVPGQPDFSLAYTYTALGQVESVTDNYGVTVGSVYDNRNRLAGRTWEGPGVDTARVDLAYDASGSRLRTDRFSDLAGANRIGFTKNAYNLAGVITNITHLGPAGEVLAHYEYTFDAANQITRWSIGPNPSTYSYDATGQLTDALNTAQPDENFRFDANGNRVGAQTGGSYVAGGNNQVLSDGTSTYAYDAEGNIATRSNIASGVVTSYQFDHRNRLVNVTNRDTGNVVTQTVTFAYDAMNRRLAKVVNGQGTYFLYDRNDSWADLNSANSITARYLHGTKIDELLARQRPTDGRGWYLTDHLETVRDVMNSSGVIVAHIDYSIFGEITDIINPGATDRFTFTGRELDDESGLYFYRARYYSPHIGRFVSQDPIGFTAGDWNLYRYVDNRPLISRDPTGQVAAIEYVALLQRGALGAALGVVSYVTCKVVLNQAGDITVSSVAKAAGTGAIGAIGFGIASKLWSTAIVFNWKLQTLIATGVLDGKLLFKDCSVIDIAMGGL